MKQSVDIDHLTVAKDGAQRVRAAVLPLIPDICEALRELPSEQAGVRIHGIEALRPILAVDGAIGAVAAKFLGQRCRAVRAILFDKTTATTGRWRGIRTAQSV